MRKKAKISIQIGVLIGLMSFLAVFALAVTAMSLALRAGNDNYALLNQVGRLEEIGQAIQRRGLNYVENAPRDYCPYDRDVIVFYPDFMADLGTYDDLISAAVTAAQTEGFSASLVGASSETVRLALAELQETWSRFRGELGEKLGNPEEPRLEWGAEYIRDHKVELDNLVGKLTLTVDRAIAARQKEVDRLVLLSTIAAGILFLLIAVWFYLKVVRRVVTTADGCRRVAQGEFGYQVPVKGNDELGVLADAVNHLSSRARLVLELLENMQRTGSVDGKLAFFLSDAGAYLATNWLGLWRLGPNDEWDLVHSMATDMPDDKLRSLAKAGCSDRTLAHIAAKGEVVRINDIARHIQTRPTARLFRELARIGYAQSSLAVPLTSDDGWHGLLVLASEAAEAYDEDQAALLGNLSPLLANSLERAIQDQSQ